MRHRSHSARLATFVIISLSVLSLCVGPSNASTAPRLTPHFDYDATTPHFRLSFISHSATVIDEARAGLGGSQYVEGDVLTNCPAVSKDALASPGYPQFTLRLVHGFYSFSLSYSVASVQASYPGGDFKDVAFGARSINRQGGEREPDRRNGAALGSTVFDAHIPLRGAGRSRDDERNQSRRLNRCRVAGRAIVRFAQMSLPEPPRFFSRDRSRT